MITNLQYLADQTSAEETNQEKRMRSEKVQLTWCGIAEDSLSH